LNTNEVKIKRILRRNGQGIYKINEEIKTRQEVLELLSQAGIDPNGFNIVLQGEIDSFVKMSPDQRREVIEEVAGISIYELRKEKSLSELEKTEGKLKEASAILRERNAYLRNLEEERKAALHFKKLQEELRSYKASIAHSIIKEKEEKIEELDELILKEQSTIQRIIEIIEKTSTEIAVINSKINEINTKVQKETGLEQEKINAEISDLRADLAGLNIKQQNYSSQIQEMKKRKVELEQSIEDMNKEIIILSDSKKVNSKKELEQKKKTLEEIEEKKRKLYSLKSSLASITSRIEEKKNQENRMKNEQEFNFNRIKQIESEIHIKEGLEEHKEKSIILKQNIQKLKEDTFSLSHERYSLDKTIAVMQRKIEDNKEIQSKVSSIDICPLCQTKITKEHMDHVATKAQSEITNAKETIDKSAIIIKQLDEKIKNNNMDVDKKEEELRRRVQDISRLENLTEKKEQLRSLTEQLKIIVSENKELERKKRLMEDSVLSFKTSELNYDSLKLEVQELERQQERDLGMEATLKQRDVERSKNALRQIQREEEDVSLMLKETEEKIHLKSDILEEKNDQDRLIKEKFRKIIEEKNKHQEKIRLFETDLIHKQNNKHISEEKINSCKVERAQYLAQKESIEQESKEFEGAKIIRMDIESLRSKLEETKALIERTGSVNMRALEVYEQVKIEYEKVQEKVNKILEEKNEILKIIEDIDKKETKEFMKTLSELNQLFSRNFSQLSTKGIATLEITNKEDIFKGGIDMVIKVGKGKYFDTRSLSGGEQSLISLSLIFAIQEYKPYSFYIFDEIDAALDRHNSERLASLLKKYMNNGQYIIITHNDSLITESPVIYGVSMQDKISKVLSLEV
jgi:chromosome segregation protein